MERASRCRPPLQGGVADLSNKFPHYADLIQAYDTHWEDSIDEVILGTVKIVQRLKNQGWPLYLLSNFSAEKFPIMLRKYEFIHLFDDVIISGDHKIVKPNPDIFHLTLQRIRYSAEECLFIDDSPPNIQTAKSLGFQTIHFLSAEQLDLELKKFQI